MPYTVLVVEGNSGTRQRMVAALQAAGHRVLAAADGKTAVSAVVAEKPDVVMQDLLLPDMDGIELARRIRALPEGPEVLLVALSGPSSKVDEARELAGGFAEFLFKPVEPSRVVRLIDDLLPSGPGQPPEQAVRLPNLLLVNDDPMVRKLHRIRLEQAGFLVRIATGGKDALTQARASLPDVIVSNLLMPEMDGLDLCRAVRDDQALMHVPVILATASLTSIEESDQVLVRSAGASAIIPLTSTLQSLIDAVRVSLASSRPMAPTVNPDITELKAAFQARLFQQLERQGRLNQTLAREAASKTAQLAIMAAVADVLVRNRDLNVMLNEVLARTLDVAGVSLGAILLGGPDGRLRVASQLGYTDSDVAALEHLMEQSPLVVQALAHGRQLTVPADTLGAVPRGTGNGDRLEMDCTLLPLIAGELRVGLLFLASSQRTLSGDWSDMAAAIAAHIAQAVALARSIAQVQESEERYRAVIEGTTDMIVVKNLDGRYLMVNSAAAAAIGRDAADLIGRTDADLFDADTAGALAAADGEVVRRGTTSTTEGTLASAVSKAMTVLTTRGVFLDREGRVAGIFSVARDVTRARQLENELRQAQKMEAVGRLAGGIAHDFNNVLSVIMSYAGLLEDDLAESDARRQDVNEISQAAGRAAGLTRQLLAFSRQQVLEPRVVDLNEVVGEVDKMLRRIIGEDIELELRLLRPLGRVKADPGQLGQVIMNLAVNARDAMPSGGKLRIETGDVDVGPEQAAQHGGTVAGRYVMLAMSDTGVGMDQALQSRMFEPFFTTKEKGKGTGLGLSTVYGIITQSGGFIWVYSEPGHGTVFKIHLPRVDQVREPLTRPPVIEDVTGGHETILLVEDEAALRRAAEQILARYGYTVLTAGNGNEALAVCERHPEPIHLIVSDVIMPGLSGRESVERLLTVHPEARVLYVSGYTDDSVLRYGGLEPGVAFLQKPFSAADLGRKVREVLGPVLR